MKTVKDLQPGDHFYVLVEGHQRIQKCVVIKNNRVNVRYYHLHDASKQGYIAKKEYCIHPEEEICIAKSTFQSKDRVGPFVATNFRVERVLYPEHRVKVSEMVLYPWENPEGKDVTIGRIEEI